MKKPLILAITITALGMIGCGGGATTSNNSAPANKPANAPANAPANKPANSSTSSTDKPKETLKDAKKPEGIKDEKKAKDAPVPESWVQVYDEKKGYGFSVPEGTTGGQQTTGNGVDVFAATTPAPNEIAIFVLAYKDAKKTKKDLLNDAVTFLEALGVKATPGELKGESDDYAVADCTTVSKDGKKEKQRILVATDVTDNYVMILNTDDDKFAANEKTIEEIWGSFEMWSGGASQN